MNGLLRTVWLAGAYCLPACLPAALPLAHAQPGSDQTVVLLRDIDADRYDPQRTTSRAGGDVLFMAGDTLVGLDYDMKTPVPGLAKSWTVSDDGLTYTFTLHPHITYCSGKKLTAHDVVASYQRWLDPDGNGLVRWRAGPVDTITAADDLTVLYRLKQPYSELLMQMANYMHTIINPDQARELGPDFGVKGFDGTGPYCLERWALRNEVVLTRHAGYDWGPPIYTDPRPKVARIIWKIVPEDSTRVTALASGQADATYYLPHWSIAELRANPRLAVSRADPYYWSAYIGFKLDRAIVSDVRVRHALNLAIDRAAITEMLTFGQTTPAASLLATATPAGANHAYRYAPDEANQLLDAAGWQLAPDGYRYQRGVQNGQKLAIQYYGFNNYWKDIAEAVQGDLRKVGAELRVQTFDATAAWGKLATQEFDTFGMDFPYMSTSEALNLYFLSANRPTPNRMNWNDAQTDAWLAAANQALDMEEADAILSQALTKLSDAVVWIPLYHDVLNLVAGPRLKPLRAHSIYGNAFYKGLDLAFR